MVQHGIALHHYIPGYATIAAQGTQQEAAQMLRAGPQSGLSASFHFDSHKMAAYLRRVAVARGVVHQPARVNELVCDATGKAQSLLLEGGERLALDFLIDASGLARLGIGKRFGAKWRSFSQYLLMDRAVPFHMPHPQTNPALVTRAIAMPAGWMWQIPLIERVGAGYVFSSAHTREQDVIDEIHRRIGPHIEPMRTLHFAPGHFETVWISNVMAVGLASGFVEPLEATSIGQMLEQLRNFERIVTASDRVVSGHLIDDFNDANARCWTGICDFLRMHYDCPRRDTDFWCDVAELPLPPIYAQLKACFQQRTPHLIDVQSYAIHGWQGIFHVINWLMVGAPLGVVSRSAAAMEVAALPVESRKRIAAHLAQLQQSMADKKMQNEGVSR